jgi:hypothetical protein
MDKHLSDELGENLTIVVDGIDGRTHHIAGIAPERLEDARIGSVIQIGPAEATARPSDRTITAMAEDGIYRPSRHLEQAKFEGRVPGGDYEGYVDAHVRRLEALRRAGIVERIDADQWRISDDLVSRAAAYDAGRDRQASVRVLSPVGLEKQIGSDGATWLDRRLIHGDMADLAPTGFGQQVREAMDQRREHHIEQGDATRAQNGRVFYRRSLLATLREREVARVGADMVESKGLPFRAATHGENVSGNRAAVERQVRRGRAVPRVHPCPVAAGHRPPARPRGHRRRAGRIGVVAVGKAKGVGHLRSFSDAPDIIIF